MTALQGRQSPAHANSWAVVRDVLWYSMMIWWRTLTLRLNKGLAFLIAVLLLTAPTILSGWLYVTTKSFISPMARMDRIADIILLSLYLSFFLICVLVKTLLAAFERLSHDIRILLSYAPLTNTARAAVQIIPDLLLVSYLSLSFGLPPILVFAQHHPSMLLSNAISFSLLVICLTGALNAGIERILLQLTKDSAASRVGAALVLLFLICVALLSLAEAMRKNGLDQPELGAIGAFIATGGSQGFLIGSLAFFTGAGCVLAWGVLEGSAVHELMGAQYKVPKPRVADGSLVFASTAIFFRDASNRIGLIALGALCALAVWIENLMQLKLVVVMLSAAIVMAMSASALYSYGGYLSIQWRVLASPKASPAALTSWIIGHLLGGGLCSALLLSLTAVLSPSSFSMVDSTTIQQLLSVIFIASAFSLLAGRVLPYDKDDIASFASASTLALVLTGGAWWGLNGIDTLLQLVIAFLFFTVVVGAVAKLEGHLHDTLLNK